MTMLETRKLLTPVEFKGLGLFSGKPCRVIVRAGDGTGRVTAERSDRDGPVFAAHIDNVRPSMRNTTIAPPGSDASAHGVMTTEHLFSAMAALLLFDVHLEIYGPEIPMLDNSAMLFYRELKDNSSDGGVELPVLAVTEETTVIDAKDPSVTMVAKPPHPESTPTLLELQYNLDYGPDSPIEPQMGALGIGHDSDDDFTYGLMVAPARTFCTLTEAEQMNASGKFGHLEPADVLVIGPDGPIKNRYRLQSEPAAHKLLDMIGDFHLAGLPLAGSFLANKTGHRHSHEMIAKLVGTARQRSL